MKPILIIIVIAVVLLGGLAWLGADNRAPDLAQTASASTVLVTDTPTHDFDNLSMADGVVTHEFTVRNDGTEAVTIGKVYTSCMCTEAALRINDERFGPYGMLGHGFIPKINESLAPGQEATLLVTFDPAAHGPAGIGRVQRTITVENDAGGPLTVSFTANITP